MFFRWLSKMTTYRICFGSFQHFLPRIFIFVFRSHAFVCLYHFFGGNILWKFNLVTFLCIFFCPFVLRINTIVCWALEFQGQANWNISWMFFFFTRSRWKFQHRLVSEMNLKTNKMLQIQNKQYRCFVFSNPMFVYLCSTRWH